MIEGTASERAHSPFYMFRKREKKKDWNDWITQLTYEILQDMRILNLKLYNWISPTLNRPSNAIFLWSFWFLKSLNSIRSSYPVTASLNSKLPSDWKCQYLYTCFIFVHQLKLFTIKYCERHWLRIKKIRSLNSGIGYLDKLRKYNHEISRSPQPTRLHCPILHWNFILQTERILNKGF